MVTAEHAMDSICQNCNIPMVLEEGCYRCPKCGFTACEEDSDAKEGPRRVEDLPW